MFLNSFDFPQLASDSFLKIFSLLRCYGSKPIHTTMLTLYLKGSNATRQEYGRLFDIYQSPSNVILFEDSFSSSFVTPGEMTTAYVPFPPEYFLFAGVDQFSGLTVRSGLSFPINQLEAILPVSFGFAWASFD